MIVLSPFENTHQQNIEMEMERIHRMGKQSRPSPSPGTRVQETSQTSRPRTIIVKFLRYQDKENIRKAAHKLKGSSIGIGEQFPKPIYDARRRLYPRTKGINGIGQTAHKWSTLQVTNKSRHMITSIGGK